MLAVVCWLSLTWNTPLVRAEGDAVRVTVVAVLASTETSEINPKLKELAKEVRKRDATLTGFKLASSSSKSVPVNESVAFPLIEQQELKVKAEKPDGENGKVRLTIKPPGLGEVSYTCACDKFFPVVTPYKTSGGERLIVAVSAKPCGEKKE